MKGKKMAKATKIILGLLMVMMIAGCSEPTTKKTTSDCPWQNLFDGKSLNGWVQRGGKAIFKAEKGSIVGYTNDDKLNSFLCTEKDYRDFILELDFKVDNELNSGVQIRSQSIPEYKNGVVHGYQVEIDPSIAPYTREPKNLRENGQPAPDTQPRRWTGGIQDESRRGWLNDLTKNPQARKAYKNGQWNHFRIEAIGDSMKTWLNGVPAADLTDSMTPEGFIALQVHKGPKNGLKVEWRNIRIKDLSSDPQKKEPVM